VLVARFRFIEIRPYIFKYFFIVLFIYLLESRKISLPDEDYRLSKQVKKLYLLPLLMLFWANLHGTFFLGLVILGAYILGELLQRSYFRSSSDNIPISLKPLLLTFTTCLLITLINPYGYKFHQWTLKLFILTAG
ncbi:MAG TPA: hypothetical protein DHV62_09105, partial [Elusimicrobia bacterium]|nr:hypothetical protein [Elusimicrobiota bacterium]